MAYIGAQPTSAAFPFDQFSGDGVTTTFNLSYTPANTTSIVVTISGVVQNPATYGLGTGATLTFTGTPPAGTNNITVLYLGIPASGVTIPGNTAYLSTTEFTATDGQTTFTPSGTYQVGFVQVFRNGVRLPAADYTASNGATVVLANACVAGDSVSVQVYNLTSVTSALPSTGGVVTGASTFNSNLSVGGNLIVSGNTTVNGSVTLGDSSSDSLLITAAPSIGGAGLGMGMGFRNRIINGAMVIDQRNAGAAYTITGDVQYGSVDRFLARTYGGPGRFSMQQVTDAPADFLKSLKVTVTTTDTSGTYGYSVEQRIEGLNITDFNFGTASAATYTMSFWVKASIAGTYTCGNRTTSASSSCVNTYTINSANTWEKKTIVFPANTGFTTGTDNGIGLICDFGFGAQTSKATSTLGVWQAGNYVFNSGQVDLMATSGATFYITGVQLEKGSTATSFDYRPYGTELALCQRYFYKWQAGTSYAKVGFGRAYSTTNGAITTYLPQPMRATPTGSYSSLSHFDIAGLGNPTAITIPDGYSADYRVPDLNFTRSGATTGVVYQMEAANTTSAFLTWSAEL